MEKYICENCKKESKIQLVWADELIIEGTLYHVENSRCEHCEELTTIKKIKKV